MPVTTAQTFAIANPAAHTDPVTQTADAPVIELAAQTDYEECLACQ